MALTAGDVLARASEQLLDQTNIRWSQAELLRYLNDARREIAVVRPDLYATSTTVTLVQGTKQLIPADGSCFLDGVRNVTAADALGKAVRVVEREVMDAHRPGWHTEADSTEIKHFMLDERSPRIFYVYPPAAAGHKLEIVYCSPPADIELADIATTELTQEGVYTNALVDYVCYRAFAKDAEYAGNDQRAASYYGQFAALLRMGTRTTMAVTPNTANAGGTPPRMAAPAVNAAGG